MADIAHVALVLSNAGEDGDVLVGVDVPPQIAGAAGIDDLPLRVYRGANLRRSQPLFLPAGETRILAFDDVHLVIYGIRGEFARGMRFPVRLTFERAGALDILVEVGGATLETSARLPAKARPALIRIQHQAGPATMAAADRQAGSRIASENGGSQSSRLSKAGDQGDSAIWSRAISDAHEYQASEPSRAGKPRSLGESTRSSGPEVNLIWIKPSACISCARSYRQHLWVTR